MLATKIVLLGVLAFFGTGVTFCILLDNEVKKGLLFLAIWMAACIGIISTFFPL